MVEHAFITENFASWIIDQMYEEFIQLPDYKKYMNAGKYIKRIENQIFPNMTEYSRKWLIEARDYEIALFRMYASDTKVYDVI